LHQDHDIDFKDVHEKAFSPSSVASLTVIENFMALLLLNKKLKLDRNLLTGTF